MKLSPRLQAIADSIKSCTILADIGTDHAYIPIYLALEGCIDHAIAADINKGPLEIAQKGIQQYRLDDKIETRLGSGLTVLKPHEAEAIVIAGMGGMLIAEIIEASKDVAMSAKDLVLQPMQDSGKLRKYLLEQGFEIIDEELAKEDRKIYEILWVKYTGHSKIVESFIEIGPKVIEKKHPLAIELIDKKIKELKDVLEKLQAADTETSQRRRQECLELLEYYNEVKKWVQ